MNCFTIVCMLVFFHSTHGKQKWNEQTIEWKQCFVCIWNFTFPFHSFLFFFHCLNVIFISTGNQSILDKKTYIQIFDLVLHNNEYIILFHFIVLFLFWFWNDASISQRLYAIIWLFFFLYFGIGISNVLLLVCNWLLISFADHVTLEHWLICSTSTRERGFNNNKNSFRVHTSRGPNKINKQTYNSDHLPFFKWMNIWMSCLRQSVAYT